MLYICVNNTVSACRQFIAYCVIYCKYKKDNICYCKCINNNTLYNNECPVNVIQYNIEILLCICFITFCLCYYIGYYYCYKINRYNNILFLPSSYNNNNNIDNNNNNIDNNNIDNNNIDNNNIDNNIIDNNNIDNNTNNDMRNENENENGNENNINVLPKYHEIYNIQSIQVAQNNINNVNNSAPPPIYTTFI